MSVGEKVHKFDHGSSARASEEKLAEFQLFGCSSLDIRLLAEDAQSSAWNLRALLLLRQAGNEFFGMTPQKTSQLVVSFEGVPGRFIP